GMRWDSISQIAAALKNNGALTGGLQVQRTFMTSQITDIMTYINAIHSNARLANGKPTFDGYVVRNPASPAAINHCAQAVGGNDPRRLLKDLDVPMIGVVAQGEVVGMLASRKPDNAKYHLWEVAASSHIDKFAYSGLASWADQTAAVGAAGTQGTPQWPFSARCEPEIVMQDMPLLRYIFNGAFDAMERWVKDGVAPATAPRIEITGNTMKLDSYGIASGGIRSPYSDLPTAVYTTSSNGGGSCRELGTTTPLSWVKLEQLYGNQKAYAQKAGPAINKLVKDRFVTEADAQRMRVELGVVK
ncbi:MAG: alpha/beta hydrolase domain-containing protein, partial [Acidobacteriota bacterium]